MKKKIGNITIILIALNCVFIIFSVCLGKTSSQDAFKIIFKSILFVGFIYFVCKSIMKSQEELEEYKRAYEEEEERKRKDMEKAEKIRESGAYVKRYPVAEPIKPNGNIRMTFIPEPISAKTSTDKLMETVENFSAKKNNKPEKEPKFKNDDNKTKPVIVSEGKSKAEQEGNTVLNDEGKPIVKPNYKMIASEWVRTNFDLLNKICNDAYAISGGSGSYTATIPKDFLPEEKATWIIIGKTLVSDDDISSFKIVPEGLEVTVD